jgi:hypothetical protein
MRHIEDTFRVKFIDTSAKDSNQSSDYKEKQLNARGLRWIGDRTVTLTISKAKTKSSIKEKRPVAPMAKR